MFDSGLGFQAFLPSIITFGFEWLRRRQGEVELSNEFPDRILREMNVSSENEVIKCIHAHLVLSFAWQGILWSVMVEQDVGIAEGRDGPCRARSWHQGLAPSYCSKHRGIRRVEAMSMAF